MNIFRKFGNWINNTYWVDSPLPTLLIFLFLSCGVTYSCFLLITQKKFIYPTQREIIAHSALFQSNDTGNSRFDDNSLSIYINHNDMVVYRAHCSGGVPSQWCDNYQKTRFNNVKIKFLMNSIENNNKNMRINGNILSIQDNNGNFILDARNNTKLGRGEKNSYLLDMIMFLGFFLNDCILLIKIFYKLR